ncbi:hypothetical protein STSP2_00181 [Anaerohalosphaera lusitana]|uniref:Uncharacterized protein n=1 Tax=Anaerohalosphaera lusitana TaxID=1936003 RepID=A0A1U9NGH5_9BACT|nr:hypothetical protein [Anaerohalosphaera lusitana]AQT67042.1 hypothetical protein STSP2_00181 [Anaerohalosphaera lusitana]
MKAVKIVIGSLFAVYAVLQLLTLFGRLAGDNDTAYAQSALFGNISAIAIGAVIAFACFRSAFKQED